MGGRTGERGLDEKARVEMDHAGTGVPASPLAAGVGGGGDPAAGLKGGEAEVGLKGFEGLKGGERFFGAGGSGQEGAKAAGFAGAARGFCGPGFAVGDIHFGGRRLHRESLGEDACLANQI